MVITIKFGQEQNKNSAKLAFQWEHRDWNKPYAIALIANGQDVTYNNSLVYSYINIGQKLFLHFWVTWSWNNANVLCSIEFEVNFRFQGNDTFDVNYYRNFVWYIISRLGKAK